MACSHHSASCPLADPSRPLGAGGALVRLTLTGNRDIPNLQELEQCGHRGLRAGGGDGRQGSSQAQLQTGLASANTPGAYCVQDMVGEAFLSSLPRNCGSQPMRYRVSTLWKEWESFALTSLLHLRLLEGSGWGKAVPSELPSL